MLFLYHSTCDLNSPASQDLDLQHEQTQECFPKIHGVGGPRIVINKLDCLNTRHLQVLVYCTLVSVLKVIQQKL